MKKLKEIYNVKEGPVDKSKTMGSGAQILATLGINTQEIHDVHDFRQVIYRLHSKLLPALKRLGGVSTVIQDVPQDVKDAITSVASAVTNLEQVARKSEGGIDIAPDTRPEHYYGQPNRYHGD